MRGSEVARITIAPVFVIAGLVHVARPGVFVRLMPAAIPDPSAVVVLTGIAELAGAIGLFVPRTRRLAGIMLAVYAVCVYPVNVNHAVHDLSTGTGLGWAYHYPRLFAQPFICWWALAAGRVRWPWTARASGRGGRAVTRLTGLPKRRSLAPMDLDDLLPRKSGGDPLGAVAAQDLSPLSVVELEARVAALEAEIARTKSEISRAVNHRASADALFKQ